MASGEEPVRFVFPTIHDNPSGWGPCSVPEQFRDTPYQPFSKDDRLGKVTKELQTETGEGILLCIASPDVCPYVAWKYELISLARD